MFRRGGEAPRHAAGAPPEETTGDEGEHGPSRHRRGRGGRARRPRGYEGTRGDRGGREPSFREETVRVAEDGTETTVHRADGNPRPRRGEPVRRAPGGGGAEAAPGAGGEQPRRSKNKLVRVGTAAAFVALAGAGLATLLHGNSAPKEVPTGPSLLEGTNASAPANPTGEAQKQEWHNDVQRLVNNGENKKTVTVVPGVLSFNTPDGQRDSIANPIVDLDGLPAQVVSEVKAGHFDMNSLATTLDGRVFGTGPAKDTPTGGMEHNWDRGVVDIDVTGTEPAFTPAAKGPHVTEVAVSWETQAPVAVGAEGPLEQNKQTGQVAQHDVGGNWQPMLVGAHVETPPTQTS